MDYREMRWPNMSFRDMVVHLQSCGMGGCDMCSEVYSTYGESMNLPIPSGTAHARVMDWRRVQERILLAETPHELFWADLPTLLPKTAHEQEQNRAEPGPPVDAELSSRINLMTPGSTVKVVGQVQSLGVDTLDEDFAEAVVVAADGSRCTALAVNTDTGRWRDTALRCLEPGRMVRLRLYAEARSVGLITGIETRPGS